ncbi:MAG: 3-hydroxyacyl-ACP dehydratase FabZ [Proteobacteria bacterium]|nr:3-hydroxyacyl-ACP dehydratase FabZ [Pseudomonadota bacterium]
MNDVFDIKKIMEALPHRYPFLLLDKVKEIDPGKKIVAIKNVTINEPFFNGHFPSEPVMPGVLILEALAQAAVVLMYAHTPVSWQDHIAYFASIESAHFRKPVRPGDTLHLIVTISKQRGNMWKTYGEAQVDGQKVADGLFSAMLVNKY